MQLLGNCHTMPCCCHLFYTCPLLVHVLLHTTSYAKTLGNPSKYLATQPWSIHHHVEGLAHANATSKSSQHNLQNLHNIIATHMRICHLTTIGQTSQSPNSYFLQYPACQHAQATQPFLAHTQPTHCTRICPRSSHSSCQGSPTTNVAYNTQMACNQPSHDHECMHLQSHCHAANTAYSCIHAPPRGAAQPTIAHNLA